MYKVKFWSSLVNRHCVKSFDRARDAVEFASEMNGIIIA